jgi:hypothetical protein
MAQQGYYIDPPSRRLTYDRDGTTVLLNNSGQRPRLLDANTTSSMNGSADGAKYTISFNQQSDNTQLYFIFPEGRILSHYQFGIAAGFSSQGSLRNPGGWYYSFDTTNGVDGTWTFAQQIVSTYATNLPYYRDNIQSFGTLNGVKGLRADFGISFQNAVIYMDHMHLYGAISSGQTPDRLEWCDVNGSPFLNDFDFGDQARGTARTWTPSQTYNQVSGLYIKNRSSTRTVTDVTVTLSSINELMATATTLSKDNAVFTSFITYNSIIPQQIVGPIYVRHNPTTTSTLAAQEVRLCVDGTWS